MDREGVELHERAKKERGQYRAVLTEQAWSINKDVLYGFRGRNTADSSERVKAAKYEIQKTLTL